MKSSKEICMLPDFRILGGNKVLISEKDTAKVDKDKSQELS